MVNKDKIIEYCSDYLQVNDFEDHCHNGLQVEGSKQVNKIITGVSISQKLIESAIEKKAEMIIVHHGLFSRLFEKKQIKGIFKNRLKLLLSNDINLVGFHLPLDAHPEIGNNISLCKLLGINKNVEKFVKIGFIGELDKEINFSDLVQLVNDQVKTNSYSLSAGPQKSSKIAVISGSASSEFSMAADKGADTYICGDIREEVVRGIEEMGMNFINAGHYNTEVFGVRNLGELLSEKFDVEAEFVDIPNEI